MVSFNKDDLSFVLQQIKIAEAHSGLYGAPSQPLSELIPNPLLPWGLRTVSGIYNNIIPGRELNGSADQPFLHLTTPDYGTGTAPLTPFDVNGPAPGGVISNTNYATTGSVVDTAPRTISNLIVDQTLNNPAAIIAALEYAGITGTAATAAKNLILSQHQAIAPLETIAAQKAAAEAQALLDRNQAQSERDTAFSVDAAAQDTVNAYNDAIALAPTAVTSATEARDAFNLFASLVGPVADPGDFALLTAAILEAVEARDDADAILAALQSGPNVTAADLLSAQSIADNAGSFVGLLQALESALLIDPNVNGGDVAAAAALGITNVIDANAVAANLSDADSLGQATTDAGSAAATLAIEESELTTAINNYNTAVSESNTADANLASASTALDTTLANNGIEITPNGTVSIPNVAPDEGISAPFNSWMTLFGQFFDHGLDLVAKTSTSKVYIPLQPDDPLYVEGGTQNFMVITRTTESAPNLTTPLVDQNQTYTSNASHQVFLREYVRVGNETFATGHLLEGSAGGLATWADIKAQALSMLGIELTDQDIHNVPLLATDDYGRFIRGDNGYAQIVVQTGPNTFVHVSGTADGMSVAEAAALAGGTTVLTGHAFLDDIAHTAAPAFVDPDRNPGTDNSVWTTADADGTVGNGFSDQVVNEFGVRLTYDNELLDRHFITGDGRGNENIGLTTVHHVFHSEHNRLAEHTKDVTIASGDLAFINEWLIPGSEITQGDLDDINALSGQAQADAIDALNWNGERLFQAARFGTEMQYQHLVFEEFARKVNPMVDLFVFNPTMDINPAIFAEFAHTVYRFGHSMLNDTVDRLGADGQTSDDIGLIEAFLNPVAFNEFNGGTVSADVAAGAVVRGMTRQQGNEIDEFVTEALRNNLLGLPLDLATVNLARGRETGIPTLNEARAQFYAEARSEWLKPYTSWADFAQHLKNPASVINFIAAYGTHSALTNPDVDTLIEKRAIATALVLGGSATYIDSNGDTQTFTATTTDRQDFLNSRGAYAGDPALGGLNNVDLWIGGLAESILPFGGMLGSTFTFVFEKQMENLQNGDRFYYLSRTQGLHFLQELENNAFSKIIMSNTDLGAGDATHLPGEIFSTPQHILEINQIVQNTPDPVHEDEVLQGFEPKVARDLHLTVDGNTYDRSLKFTGGEHVVLGGTEGDDVLIADLGDDTIWGDGGNDYIEGGHGINRLHGGTGDDIIYGGGDPEFIHGDEGNDVINGGNGLGDLIFGGSGHDFVIAGIDSKEVFAAEGNDFVLGTPDVDLLLGGEGDDWIEGGEGFDTIAGENSQLFFNSSIIGHDVMFAGTNEMDFDAESGDDIMVQGESVMRNEGMFGFDWAIFKDMQVNGYADMRIKIFTTVEADILRNRFDRTEALSGWNKNDTLIGDDREQAFIDPLEPEPLVPENIFAGDELDEAGADRIAGFRDLFDYNGGSFKNDTGDFFFDRGNVILGGGGSDVIQGGGGDDLIDGDQWLNVRIGINDVNGNQIGTADYMQGKVNFYSAAEAAQLGAGHAAASAALLAKDGQKLDGLMFNRTLNADQLSIVREIVDAPAGDTGVDVAVYQGKFTAYTFTDNGDGTALVDHTFGDPRGGGILHDGTDLLRNIEVIRFMNDGNGITEFTLADILAGNIANAPGTATLSISDTTPINNDILVPTVANIADTDGIVLDPTGLDPLATLFTLQWQSSADGTVWTDVGPAASEFDLDLLSAATFRPRAAEVGLMLRFVITYADTTGFNNTIASLATDPVGDNIRGTNAADVPLNGTIGGDIIDARRGNDVVNGLGGNDTFIGTVLDGNDTYDGGTGIDTYDISATTEDANINLLAGIATSDDIGTDTLISIENAIGSQGINVLIGSNGDNVLTGLGGNDTLTGGIGNDTLDGGVGTDIASFADAVTTASFALDGTNLKVTTPNQGTDTLTGIEILRFAATNYNLRQGTTGANTLAGTAAAEIFIGFGGGDTLTGLGGNDVYVTGGGDTIVEGAGGGTDTIVTSLNAFSLSSVANIENLAFNGSGDFVGTGTAAGNVITGNTGNDRFIATLNDGNDTYNGGAAGSDTYDLSGTTAASTVNLTAGTATSAQTGTDTLVSIENVIGSSANNVITGNTANNKLDGGGGNDTFNYSIGGGADTIIGGANGGGAGDILNILGATNNDVLDVIYNGGALITDFEGGTVTDVETINVNLGGSADTISYAGSTSGVIVNLGANTASGLTSIVNVSNVTGTAQADSLTGNAGANVLDGGADADTLAGGNGDDTYVADSSDIIVELAGAGTGTDTVRTAEANFSLLPFAAVENLAYDNGAAADASFTGTGNALANTITGGSAADILNGGAGGDILIGGGGADNIDTGAADDNVLDRIRYSDAADYGDTVSNFDANGTVDRVEFGGALNTRFDDRVNTDTIQFVSGNNAAGTVNANVNTTAEALYLSGNAGEGVTNANLSDLASVATAFNNEFVITANNNEDALLVLNDTDANSFAIYQWIQLAGGTGEIDINELQLVGIFNANATATTANVGFF